MNVVLIGSGGYIGKNLQRSLETAGHRVSPLSSSTSGGIDPDTGWLPEDAIREPDIDVVIHLAQSPWSTAGHENPAHVLAVNVVSAVQAARAAVRVGAERFLYASTGNVYRPSFSPLSEQASLTTDNWYSLSKVHAEQALLQFSDDIEIRILRLFGVYGPGQSGRLVPNLIDRVRRQQTITLMPGADDAKEIGGLRLSLTYIDDIIDAFATVATNGGPQTMNVAGDEVLSIEDIAREIGLVLNLKPKFEVLDKARGGDLIADPSLYRSLRRHEMTTFRNGIRATLAALD